MNVWSDDLGIIADQSDGTVCATASELNTEERRNPTENSVSRIMDEILEESRYLNQFQWLIFVPDLLLENCFFNSDV